MLRIWEGDTEVSLCRCRAATLLSLFSTGGQALSFGVGKHQAKRRPQDMASGHSSCRVAKASCWPHRPLAEAEQDRAQQECGGRQWAPEELEGGKWSWGAHFSSWLLLCSCGPGAKETPAPGSGLPSAKLPVGESRAPASLAGLCTPGVWPGAAGFRRVPLHLAMLQQIWMAWDCLAWRFRLVCDGK